MVVNKKEKKRLPSTLARSPGNAQNTFVHTLEAAEKAHGDTAGGVNANASKAHLLDVAKQFNVTGRSQMTKGGLIDAINKANRRATARAGRTRPLD